MYRIRREQDRIEVILNAQGGSIYSATPEEYIIFKESEDAKKYTVKRVRELEDDQLLLALATVVRISPLISKTT